MDYQAACEYATEEQGLNPALEALEAAGVPVSVDQTGGFCMCVRVQGEDPKIYVWVTASDIEAGLFIASLYRDGLYEDPADYCWECKGEQCYGHNDATDVRPEDLATVCRDLINPPSSPRGEVTA